MKMKRALKCIGAVALAASLMMVPSMIPVQASKWTMHGRRVCICQYSIE